MEKFYKNGHPVWRKRNAEHRPEKHQKFVDLLIKRLVELERQTRPSGGKKTAAGKDIAALNALQFAGHLVDALAGWALDHQVGLALSRLEFWPLGTAKLRDQPEYIQGRAQVDSHEHEREGGAVFSSVPGKRMTPLVARRALKNLLLANPGGFERRLSDQLYEAFEALEWGEVAPILEREKIKPRFRKLRCELQPLLYVEYMRGCGGKHKAQTEVAQAFGIDHETVRTWEKRLRQEFGAFKIAQQFDFARNAGSYIGRESDLSAVHEYRFGRPALMAAAEEYKNIKTTSRNKNLNRKKRR